MKIAWFTPLHEASAIGRYSVRVVEQLRRLGHQVEIVRTEVGEWRSRAPQRCAGPVYFCSDTSVEHLRVHFDVAVYNVGDHYYNHGAALSYIAAVPGIAIFHDFFLYNLFRNWHRLESPLEAVARQAIVDHYHDDVHDAVASFERGDVGYESAAMHHPMTEWIASQCIGALVHAQFYAPRVQASCSGPVAVHHLTYALAHELAPPSGGEETLNLLTIGMINQNKCVDRVIDAIAHSPTLRARARYRIVGQIDKEYRRALEARAEAAGVAEQVKFLGETDHATLAHELERSDAICCLRSPVLEGASASAIEGLLSGRPILVADDGFYGELPDDMAIKIGKAVDVDEIAWRLDQLALDPADRLARGARAQAWARQHFSVESYCQTLVDLCDQVISITPLARVADQAAWRLSHLGVRQDDPAAQRIAAVMQALFMPSGA
jgi:glycosyltransferase involved in cell wall biosynthesis